MKLLAVSSDFPLRQAFSFSTVAFPLRSNKLFIGFYVVALRDWNNFCTQADTQPQQQTSTIVGGKTLKMKTTNVNKCAQLRFLCLLFFNAFVESLIEFCIKCRAAARSVDSPSELLLPWNQSLSKCRQRRLLSVSSIHRERHASNK